jgi:cytochrome c oxidase subunit 2
VRFNLRANDVIHSFWVPQFLEKRDVIPGFPNTIDVNVTRTGTWTGRCAEFCGLNHWEMNFEVRAMRPDDFRAWIADHRTGGDPAPASTTPLTTSGAAATTTTLMGPSQ